MRFVFGVAFLLILAHLAAPAEAQTATDNWNTAEECHAALNPVLYRPSIRRERKLATNEEVRPLGYLGCVQMELPDRKGGIGWVQIDAARLFVFSKTTGRPIRLEECNNEVYSVQPLRKPQALVQASAPQALPTPAGQASAPIQPSTPSAVEHKVSGELDLNVRGQVELVQKERAPEPPKPGFFERHKWAKPTLWGVGIGGAVLGTYCATKGCFTDETNVSVTVNNR